MERPTLHCRSRGCHQRQRFNLNFEIKGKKVVTQRRGDAEGEKQKPFCFLNLYFSAPSREILFLGFKFGEGYSEIGDDYFLDFCHWGDLSE